MMLQLHDDYLGANLSKVRRDLIKTPRKNIIFTESQPVLPLWPPMSWDSFKPKTYADIENHYYNFSPGCSSSWLNWAVEVYLYVVAAVVTIFTAGAGAPVSAAIAGAADTVGDMVGDITGDVVTDILKQKIEETVKTGLQEGVQNGITSAQQAAMGSGRPRIDYGDEVDRIRDSYINNYSTPAFNLTYLETYTKSQLENKLINFKDALQVSIDKCNKNDCDRPGCRDAGILTLRVQYVELLLSVYEATNTTTPAEYNQVISAEFFANIPAQDLEGVVQKIKEEKAKKTAAVGAFLILGAIFSGLLKKS